jgi:UPF0716 family protein affecting phage T7 exclusion
MFGLIRTIILVMIAFVAGLLIERNQTATACNDQGGMMLDRVCERE